MNRQIEIKTADGLARAGLFRPDEGQAFTEGAVTGGAAAAPGVIFYMDGIGPRKALDDMAQRLANAGYVVLLPDLFYRFGDYGPFDASAFSVETTRNQILHMLRTTTQEMTRRDTGAFLDTLAAEGVTGPIGAVGYCMGGGRALTAAATYADRIAAAASFHGGHLASDAPDSPHRQAASIKGRVYVGVAGVDGSFPPEQSARLAEALRSAEIDHVIENYAGKGHGWTVPDLGAYDEAGAERHWKRLLEFFGETLR
ncbi:MAG: dienelactone hydrolase family protein [Microvirga sp.]